ncbi:MAG: NAD-dependent epimerase/dehydratase family protein [Ignavibacteriae bacterium]|jgi:nucleoside-diphosphate-sugar epimerase|nr:NAD-dependent epimerase/dehydratase family protein [Ignavibacteriota bacterium]NOG98404.1 NAD-dependent epimerase/dehydratase family protein [Ignavibacteriota bacterium]
MDEHYLVLGATGGIGKAIVAELTGKEKTVSVLCRDKEKGEKYFKDSANVKIITGDAFNAEDVIKASQNCTALFYCINTHYHKWAATVRPLLKISIDACIKNNVKLVFPGNVYTYGFAQYNRVDELHPKFPNTKKGRIRLDMENMLFKAGKDEGLNFAIIRMPDFYGPYVINGFSEQVFINALTGKTLKWIGSKNVEVEYIFIEDAAKAMVEGGLSEKSNRREFNIPACCETTTEKFLKEISEQGGKESKMQVLNSNFIFTLMGLFNPIVREVKEMLYLKRHKLILDGSQYKKTFGELPATSYEKGIKKTLDWARGYYNIN